LLCEYAFQRAESCVEAPLTPNGSDMHSILPTQLQELFSFGQVLPKRPLDKEVLAGLQCRAESLKVAIDSDRTDYEVDIVRGGEI